MKLVLSQRYLVLTHAMSVPQLLVKVEGRREYLNVLASLVLRLIELLFVRCPTFRLRKL